MKQWLPILALGAMVLAACSKAEDPAKLKATRAKSPYFDMVGFLNELERNSKGHPLRKTALAGDKVEQGVSEEADYRKELAIFFSADITKPAWAGQFNTATSPGNTVYTANTEKPELRMLVVHKDDKGAVKSLDVSLYQKNYLYFSQASGSIFVRYDGEKPMLDSLSLSGEQKVILGSPLSYAMTGKIL